MQPHGTQEYSYLQCWLYRSKVYTIHTYIGIYLYLGHIYLFSYMYVCMCLTSELLKLISVFGVKYHLPCKHDMLVGVTACLHVDIVSVGVY